MQRDATIVDLLLVEELIFYVHDIGVLLYKALVVTRILTSGL